MLVKRGELTRVRTAPALRLIELFALPGAGKTTLVNAAAALSQFTTRKDLSARWAATPRAEQRRLIARALADPARLAAALRLGVAARIRTKEGLFRLLKLVAKTEWLRSQQGVLVLDQGFLQDLWSILVSGKSRPFEPFKLAGLMKVLYNGIDTTVLVIEVDPSIAAVRVSGRTHGDSRFEELPQQELRGALAAASVVQGQVKDAAMLAGLPVQVVDGTAPVSELAGQLHALLPARAVSVERSS